MATGEAWRDRATATRFATERARTVPQSAVQIEVLLHLLRHRDGEIRRIVDLGSGDAVLLATILDAYPEATGVALDYSPAMRELAAKRLAPLGARARAEAIDLRDGWVADAAADVVVSGFAIHHLPDARKRTLFAEIFAALAPGGTFLDLEHVASATPAVAAAHDEAIIEFWIESRRAAGALVDEATVRAEYVGRPDKADNILAPVELQCRWLREIGFTDVDVFWKWFELALFGGTKPRS
jgi:tRNA (cmo5U34)-methyltransferase